MKRIDIGEIAGGSADVVPHAARASANARAQTGADTYAQRRLSRATGARQQPRGSYRDVAK